MPPSLALFLWFIILLALLRFDPAKDSNSSPAVWVSVIWMFIVGSRLPSQWLGGGMSQAAQGLEEGNPVDRVIYSVLILLAIGVLMSRSFKWHNFLARNLALTTFLSFALVSAFWSDYTFIALKRWFRDLGNYLVILIVLSERSPIEAARVLLRHLCYLLIPLSIVLIKYFPSLSIQYGLFSGTPEYMGAATSKNMLGVMCLVSGIFFFWDTVTRWSDHKKSQTRKIIVVNITFIAMTLWLLKLSNSATSSVCLVIACLMIAATHIKWVRRHPTILKGMIPTCFCLYLILAYALDINKDLVNQVGRDSTFTGRTEIWKAVLSTDTNWLVGAGYESFWLGPRLRLLWPLIGAVNEAHSGYLEIYLNLGWIGLVLGCIFFIASYRTICRELPRSYSIASLALALWIVVCFYNVTESAAFRGHFIWVTFMLATIIVPTHAPSVCNVSAKESSIEESVLVMRDGAAVIRDPIISSTRQERGLVQDRAWTQDETSSWR